MFTVLVVRLIGGGVWLFLANWASLESQKRDELNRKVGNKLKIAILLLLSYIAMLLIIGFSCYLEENHLFDLI